MHLKTKNYLLIVPVAFIHGAIIISYIKYGGFNEGAFGEYLGFWKVHLAATVAATLVTILFTGLVSPMTKARLVYMRWDNPLPGARVFTVYAPRDPRIDLESVAASWGVLPTDPVEQNRLWYKIYKQNEAAASVSQAHQYWLLTRDLAALSALLIVLFSALQLVFGADWRDVTLYWSILAAQYFLVTLVARSYGIRFSLDVLAVASSRR